MSPILSQSWTRLTQFWSERTVPQRILLAGLTASGILAFILMVVWLNSPDYKVLYSKLNAEDAARVVEDLKANKVPYELADNGTTVLIPAESVYEQRLKQAGEGTLRGTGIGFEIFDDTKIGQTDFVQRINYQRALQGEISRTIAEYPQIEKARVHLVLPSKSLFIEEQKKASASVVLTMASGAQLDPKQIQGIVNFVAMSVEGLDKNMITITDTEGKVLYQSKGDDSLDAQASAQMDMKSSFERNAENRIEQLLQPILGGHDKAIAKVNATLDFSQKTIRKESYDPDKTVVRSENRSQETVAGRANVDAAVPEANFRGDGFTGTQSSQQGTRETRVTNFEIDKVEQNIISPVGELQKLSVAVAVDGTYEKKPEGGFNFIPRSQEELDRIKQLVSNAVGLDAERGDSIEVSTFSFGPPADMVDSGYVEMVNNLIDQYGRHILNAVLILLFLILVVRPVVLALIRPRVTQEEIETLDRLPEFDARIALAEGEDLEPMEALEPGKRLEYYKNQCLHLFEANTEQAVSVMRTWLKHEAA